MNPELQSRIDAAILATETREMRNTIAAAANGYNTAHRRYAEARDAAGLAYRAQVAMQDICDRAAGQLGWARTGLEDTLRDALQ